MSDTLHLNPSRATDINGFAVPGALAYFYNSGTSTLRRVYADAAGATPLPQPVQANGAGLFPMIFDLAAGEARVVVTTPEGAMLPGYPLDPVPRSSVGDAGARGIVFAATDDIPVTNVQAAIERVQENIVAPLADFGLGVTGNAVLVNDLDSPTRASGFYRYDGTTAGTFPAGVVAANGGVLSIWRQTSTRLLQQLSPITGGRVWQRIHDGAWGPWRWLLTSADTVDDATWRAGTSTVPAAVTPAAVRAALGVAAGAPVYACRAWVNFDGSGTTPVIRASGNVSGVTKPSSGRYVVTLAEAMPDANYAVSATANSGAEFSARVTAQTATTITIEVMGDYSNRQNPSHISAAVFA